MQPIAPTMFLSSRFFRSRPSRFSVSAYPTTKLTQCRQTYKTKRFTKKQKYAPQSSSTTSIISQNQSSIKAKTKETNRTTQQNIQVLWEWVKNPVPPMNPGKPLTRWSFSQKKVRCPRGLSHSHVSKPKPLIHTRGSKHQVSPVLSTVHLFSPALGTVTMM